MRMAIAVLALAGCAGTKWRATDVKRVKAEQQILIVTKEQAFLYDVISTTADALHGVAVRAWSVPPGSFTVREDESPVQLAHRLEWTPTLPERAPSSIRTADVWYASARGSTGEPVVQALPFVAGVALIVVLGGALFPEGKR